MSLGREIVEPPTFKVLLVDDHDETREGYAAYLRFAGVDVETASNGQEAIRKASPPPDAIVMDLAMPGMDGWQAVRVLRSHRTTRGVPILALSAQIVDGSEEQRAKAAGFDAFCRKPCLPSRLLTLLRSLLRSRRSSRADPSSGFEPSPTGA